MNVPRGSLVVSTVHLLWLSKLEMFYIVNIHYIQYNQKLRFHSDTIV